MPTFDSDKPMSVLGVRGRLTHRTTKPGQAPGLWCNQKWISEARPVSVKDWGNGRVIRVEMRFDDQCGNGHNSFAITAHIEKPGARDWDAGGCLHDEIVRYFPELAPLIKWHLTSSDGPMHYIGNTLYHAGDRDHNGLLAGESRQIRNGKTGELCWKLAAVDTAGDEIDPGLPKYADAPEKPVGGYRMEYVPWCRVGEGKARNLDAARSCAVWPEATDAELCADPAELKKALEARHPALVAEFKKAIEGAGFVWTPEELKEQTQ